MYKEFLRKQSETVKNLSYGNSLSFQTGNAIKANELLAVSQTVLHQA